MEQESSKPVSNYTMIFGCDPEYGVIANTKLISTAIEHMIKSFDSLTGSLKVPDYLGLNEQRKVYFESV